MADASQNSATAAAELPRHVTLRSGVALVVANIIGAGIFTTTGFQAADLGHPGLIFVLWIVGGVLAFCGALCYGELAAAMPEGGAEYVYLRETYGGVFGFMSAFVSLVAGFSAPIAAVAIGLMHYLSFFLPILERDPAVLGFVSLNDLCATLLVWLLIAIQLAGARPGMRFSDVLTVLKVAGIVAIILAAAFIGKGVLVQLWEPSPRYAAMTPLDRSAAMATSLIFVMFCYSGWNASAYIAGEFKNPERDLPRSLLLGTLIVVVLYLGLNAVYFYGAGVEGLAGEVEVGLIAARELFGPWATTFVTIVLVLSLLASATAMTIAGPRVYHALGRDYRLFRWLARTHPQTGAPVTALLTQGIVTSLIVLTGRIDTIQQYAGFTLTLFASLAVSCVIVLRRRRPEMPRPFRSWGYPFTPLLFLVVSAWMMIWSIRGRPLASLLALATVLAGGAIFYLTTGGAAPESDRRHRDNF